VNISLIEEIGIRFLLALRLVSVIRGINRVLRRVTAYSHHVEFLCDWGGFRRPPEWFDHLFEQYWRWRYTRNPMSWERGVFATLVMPEGARILDLCCGGGFFSYHFYSSRASSVIGVDFDPKAIAHARRNFSAQNIEFVCGDIRTDMPIGPFDTIVWNAAIEHFTQAEIASLITAIKARLAPTGILTGYTLVEKESGKSHPDHEYEFKSQQDLADLLRPFFVNVTVLDTKWRDQLEERENLYFFASDTQNLPFGRAYEAR
jgi:SAM-dependent methyltransferase